MKKYIIFFILFIGIAYTSGLMAQVSASTHEHETEPPIPEEKIKLEAKNSKKHVKVEKKTKEQHAKDNLKMSKKRVKVAGTGTFGAIGYDGNPKYTTNPQKKHLKAKKD